MIQVLWFARDPGNSSFKQLNKLTSRSAAPLVSDCILASFRQVGRVIPTCKPSVEFPVSQMKRMAVKQVCCGPNSINYWKSIQITTSNALIHWKAQNERGLSSLNKVKMNYYLIKTTQQSWTQKHNFATNPWRRDLEVTLTWTHCHQRWHHGNNTPWALHHVTPCFSVQVNRLQQSGTNPCCHFKMDRNSDLAA